VDSPWTHRRRDNVMNCLSMAKNEADPIKVPAAIHKDAPTEVFCSGPMRTIGSAGWWIGRRGGIGSREIILRRSLRDHSQRFARPGPAH
jgi:hypothetical protein